MANEPQDGVLIPAQFGVYTGDYPADKQVANSVTELEGKKWTMVRWPLPADELSRNILILHEIFHYRQHELGLDPGQYSNDHMENPDARILMKMEWSALGRAINAVNEEELRQAVAHALEFRNMRRYQFENSTVNENRFEIHEGMAEYTGRKLSCRSDEQMARLSLDEINLESDRPLVRTFAYVSGPIYGYLLDRSGMEWRSGLTPDSDLGGMLAEALNIAYDEDIPNFLPESAYMYGYDRISEFENELATKREAVLANYRSRLIDGPILRIPLLEMSISFDPSRVFSLGQAGTVYETIRLVTAAGILEVDRGGCLIASDWQTAYVSTEGLRMNGAELTGDGWQMTLSPEAAIEKQGDNLLVRLTD